jgi:hypothetical protein
MKIQTYFILIFPFLIFFFILWILKKNIIGKTQTESFKINIPPNYLFTSLIEKNIIQTWKSNDIPNKYDNLINSIKKYNPDYNYIFFTDKDIEVFLKDKYYNYYETYLKLPIKIQRIDFFRYIAIYHYGGFYLDLDVLCLKSFDDLLEYECVFPVDEIIFDQMCNYERYNYFCKKNIKFLLGQYAFAAMSNNLFIKQIIDNIHNNIDDIIKSYNKNNFEDYVYITNFEDYVYITTGPDYVTKEYINYKDKKNIHILQNGKRQYFGDYAKHEFFGTWK